MLRLITTALMWFALAITASAEPASHPTRTEPVYFKVERAALYKRQHELLAWIGKHTKYRVDLGTPRYAFMSQDELNSFYANMNGYAAGGDVWGMYTNGTVYLNKAFQSPRDDFILLHELVHFVQWQNGAKFRCSAEMEREAYELQIKFVDEFGVGKKPDVIWMMTLRCEYL